MSKLPASEEATFEKNDPVTYIDRHGKHHDYFFSYRPNDNSICLISDGNDCYESVKVSSLKKGHV